MFRRSSGRLAESSERTSSRRPPTSWIVSAALMVVLVVCGVVVVVDIAASGSGTRRPGAGTGAGAPSGSSLPQAGDPESAGCQQQVGGVQGIPTMEPSDITWKDFHAEWLPHSANSGPMRVEAGIARCFAHTPTGALMAAAQISARVFLAADWQSVAERQLVPDPGSAAYIRKVQEQLRFAPPIIRDDPRMLQLVGFKVLMYSDDRATVALLLGNVYGSRYEGAAYSLAWHDGDWKIQAQPDGTLEMLTQQPTSADGYVRWGHL